MNRLTAVAQQLRSGGSGILGATAADGTDSPDDIVIVSAVRTPITRAGKGGLADVPPDALLSTVLKATLSRSGIDPAEIGDLAVGNVLQPGAGALGARMAMFVAGLPESVPCMTVNRQCSSGLQAFANVAGSIAAGSIDVGIAAGVESMSTDDMMSAAPSAISDAATDSDEGMDCLTPMGITSENVAEKFGITREEQDTFAAASHTKAFAAIEAGLFGDEIVPVTTEDGDVIDTDDGPRPGSSVETLSKLKPSFDEDGSTTAGNSSQISDGAAATLLMTRRKAAALGLDGKILGKFCSYAVVGVPPAIMGIGPAEAVPAALDKAGLTVSNIDIFEINEAFASQAVYCCKKLGVPLEKLNPLGGAIALGHPLGCTGNRQIGTLLHQLRRTGGRYGVVSMCIGTGMGAAAVFEAAPAEGK